jgi:transcriptional regulator with XRE-family HTH domain
MSKTKARSGFIDGTARLQELMQRPGFADAVKEVRRDMREADAAHVVSLAMIRKAAQLTQADLAIRMRVTQGAVARSEQREDMLLSTLHSYVAAAGARVLVVVELADGRVARVELDTAGSPKHPTGLISTPEVVAPQVGLRRSTTTRRVGRRASAEAASEGVSAAATRSAERVVSRGVREPSGREGRAIARTERHVLPNKTGGWDVVTLGAGRTSAHSATQAEAILRAKEIVHNAGGGEFVIHGKDGRIRSSDTVAPSNESSRRGSRK